MRSATVDWCEPNYQWHQGVAEMGNALSSIALVVSALVVQVTPVSMLCRLMIGVGSILFHATLTYYAQLLDELSMVVYVAYITSILYPTRRYLIATATVIYTIWSVVLPPSATSWQFYVFQVFFVTMTVTSLLSCIWQSRRSCYSATSRSNLRLMCIFLGSGYIAWHADNLLCSTYGHFYLHSLWHVLSSISLVYLDKFVLSTKSAHSPTQLNVLKHA